MLFNSLQFVLFLIAVCGTHWILPGRFRWILLLVASYAFYMCWSPFYITLIVASTLIDYVVAIAIDRTASRRGRIALLLTSLAANLGLLFTFKYWNFFNQSAVAISAAMGLQWQVPDLNVLLPVGISFYTFQTLSYTVDVFKGMRAERHFGRFALYVSFFPQLVAGPIERADRLLPQLDGRRTVTESQFLSAIVLILWGLFKKVVIADRLAPYVDTVYGTVGGHNGGTYLLATYAFAIQIYCDFSGYSDIAIGSARLLGIDLMTNFRSPYFATNLQDFWRRWHISLSTWLRDYLYIPLGGNRFGEWLTLRNLIVTMLLGGLWHGAGWTFVVWGLLHGGALAFLRWGSGGIAWLKKLLRIPDVAWRVLCILTTFHFICLTWVFFRAASFFDAFQILRHIATDLSRPLIDNILFGHAALGVLTLLLVEAWQMRPAMTEPATSWSKPKLAGALYFLIFAILLTGVESGRQFIYFQF